MMIYQVIEKAGNQGIWTRDIKTSTSVNQVIVMVMVMLLCLPRQWGGGGGTANPSRPSERVNF